MNAAIWQETTPPKDRPILAAGRVIFTDGCFTCVEPFFALVVWSEKPGQFPGWHDADSGLHVGQTIDDEIYIDEWLEVPGGAS